MHAVRVEGLSKRYLLGEPAGEGLLRDRLVSATRDVLRGLGRVIRGRSRGATGPPAIWALRDVSFELPEGEVLGIIGGNGAGKSTLLKILSRITVPTEGRAELRGRVGALLEVGTGFHPDLTGRENIFLNGVILGMSRAQIRSRFDEIVEFAEVEPFIDTPVKHYSSGMYVRLAFAVAAHLEPDILVVDEVLAVGDARFQKKCLGKIDAVARGGRTVLFVSHNMAAVQRLCTRALLLEHGRVITSGDPRSVIGRYLSDEGRVRYVARARTGDAQVLLAELVDSAGRPMARADITQPISARLTVFLPAASAGTRLGIGVLAADGTPIFTSNLDDVDVQLPPGPAEVSATVTIPANTLLAGEYHLVTCLWTQHDVVDLQEPAFSFPADTGGSKLYQRDAARKGVVQVRCAWDIRVPVAEAEASVPASR